VCMYVGVCLCVCVNVFVCGLIQWIAAVRRLQSHGTRVNESWHTCEYVTACLEFVMAHM